MESKEHNDHDVQFSYEAYPMGSMHMNMNDAAGSRTLGEDRRANPSMARVQDKVINSTKRTERHNLVQDSQNTSNSMSSSMKGKRF